MKDQIESTTPTPNDAHAHEIGELIYLDPKLLKPHPLGSRMPPPSSEQFEAMRDSIRRLGVISALRVTEDYEILCGHTRWRIALEEALPKVPVRVVRGLSPSEQFHLAVFENFERRHMTPSQRAAWVTHPEVFGTVNDELKAQAKDRMLKGASQKRGSKKAEAGAPQPTSRAPQTRDLLAQRVGVSGRLIDAATSGWKVAPEKMQGLLDGVIQCGVEAIANSGKAHPRKESKKREAGTDASGTDASNTSVEQRKHRPATSKAAPPRGPEPAGDPGSETGDVAALEPMAPSEPTVAEAVTGTTGFVEIVGANAEGTNFRRGPQRGGSALGSDVRRRSAKADRNLHRFVDAAISLLDSGESALVLIREVRLAWLAEQGRRRRELEESRLRDGLDAFQMTMELPQEGDEVDHERSN